MFDDLLSSKRSHIEFMLASEEKRQQVIDQMLMVIINYLNDSAIDQADWSLGAGTAQSVMPELERKGNGTPSQNSGR